MLRPVLLYLPLYENVDMYLGLRATICSYRKKTVIILLLYSGVLQEIWADIVIKTG